MLGSAQSRTRTDGCPALRQLGQIQSAPPTAVSFLAGYETLPERRRLGLQSLGHDAVAELPGSNQQV